MTQTSVTPSTAKPSKAPQAWIKRLCVYGGFLSGLVVDFAAGLNCIIGEKGVGKTSIIEFIRYVLNLFADGLDSQAKKQHKAFILGNLGGGRIELEVKTGDGMTYRISRVADEAPVVLTADGQATGMTLASLFPAMIQSLHEMETVAVDAASQLRLIDSFDEPRIQELDLQIRQLKSPLDVNATSMADAQFELSSLSDQLAELDPLEHELARMATAGGGRQEDVEEGYAARSLREQEKETINEVQRLFAERIEHLETQDGQFMKRISNVFMASVLDGPNGKRLSQMNDRIWMDQVIVGLKLDDLVNELKAQHGRLQHEADAFAKIHDEQEIAFRKILERHEEQQGQSQARLVLQKKRDDLLAKKRHRDEVAKRLVELKQQRQQLFDEVIRLKDLRFDVRHRIVTWMSKELDSNLIRVSIFQDGDRETYREFLEEKLTKSGTQKRAVAGKLVNRYSPEELAEKVKQQDVHALMQDSKLNENQARGVLECLSPLPILLTLEGLDLTDRPLIELKDGVYKPSAELSSGQRCTAILPILLLSTEGPLLMDQPDDSLDNRFVFGTIVKLVREIKKHRQLIFVMHHPNIPVLADAEQMLVMTSNGTHATLQKSGTVDACREDIIRILEGGREAFDERERRYNQ